MPIYKMDGKKDGKQKYRVRVNYQDVHGAFRQIDRVAYGLEEAKLLETSLKPSTKAISTSAGLTLRQLFDEYAAARTKAVRETTADKCKRVLELYVLSKLGDIKIDKLNIPTLQKWKNEIDATELSLTSKQNIFAEFRSLLNHAAKMEYLPNNPLLKVGNFKDALATERQFNFYTAEEFKKFIAAAKSRAKAAETKQDSREWSYYVFFAVAFYTGLRKGEINGLRWDDIKDGYLSVRRSVAQKLKGEDRETPPKNKSSIRTLQMPEPLIKILDEHKERCKKIEGFTEQRKICGFDRALRDSTIENHNAKYSAEAGIKKIRIHDFRHSHATLLVNEGINIQEIARRLGHAKIEETWNTYSHLYPREEERAIIILNKIV